MKPTVTNLGLQQIAIVGSGMMTGVGLNSPSSCAAIRCKINNFVVTNFLDNSMKPIVGSTVPMDSPLRGRPKLLHFVVPPIKECLDTLDDQDLQGIALLLCVSKENRPGRPDELDASFLRAIQDRLGVKFNEYSLVIAEDRVGGVMAVDKAVKLLQQGRCRYCIVAGVDTYLINQTILAFKAGSRLLTGDNPNGFIPGEAGSALLLGYKTEAKSCMVIKGIGLGTEKAHIESEDPLRGEGMVQAVSAALKAAELAMDEIDYRISDANGEQYVFKESALVLSRQIKSRKEEFKIWHPVECVGEIGAAIVSCSLGLCLTASRRNYAPGNRVLSHFGNDDGKRGAIVLEYSNNAS